MRAHTFRRAFQASTGVAVEVARTTLPGVYQIGGADGDVRWSVDEPTTATHAELVEGAVHTLWLDAGQAVFALGAGAGTGSVAVWLLVADDV